MRELRYLSSVSGGSIADGAAVAWPRLRLRHQNFTTKAFDDLVIDPIVGRIAGRSLKVSVITGLWRTLGSTTRTDVLAGQAP